MTPGARRNLGRVGRFAPLALAAALLLPWLGSGGPRLLLAFVVVGGAAVVATNRLQKKFGAGSATAAAFTFVLAPATLGMVAAGNAVGAAAASLIFVGVTLEPAGGRPWRPALLIAAGAGFAAVAYVWGYYPLGGAGAGAILRNLMGGWQYAIMAAPGAFMMLPAAWPAARLPKRSLAICWLMIIASAAAGVAFGPPATDYLDYVARFTPALGAAALFLAAGLSPAGTPTKLSAILLLGILSVAAFLFYSVAAGVVSFDPAVGVGPPPFLGRWR